MATLRGKNLRIFDYSGVDNIATVIAMSTSCTINLTNNTENTLTKDVSGMAAMPDVTSKAWSVSVDSLDVSNIGALLTAMKNGDILSIMWDEVSTPTSGSGATFARVGKAYLTDGTFQFNDRENSAKSLQFTGISELSTLPSDVNYSPEIAADSLTKGQFVRLFLSANNTTAPSKVVAAPKSLSLHVSLALSDATTKDTEGSWQRQEPTELSYDISINALVRSGETIASGATAAMAYADILSIYEGSTPVKWKIANVSGANNRTASSTIVSGSAILTSLNTTAAVSDVAKYDATFNGYGDYTVGS